MLDVRDPAEFRAGHRPGSRSAPGGQFVQATDTWIGVRNARIVLIDDNGVRARMAAAWLRQMGHRDVFVVEGGLEAVRNSGTAPVPVPELRAPVRSIDVPGLTHLLDAGDGTAGGRSRPQHRFPRRPYPRRALGRARRGWTRSRAACRGARHVVLTSPDGMLARLAVPEVAGAHGTAAVAVLDGGTAAWHAFGRPLVKDRTNPPDAACVDFYLRPYDRNSGVEEAMQAYLSWEIDLVREIERDGTVRFGVPTMPDACAPDRHGVALAAVGARRSTCCCRRTA